MGRTPNPAGRENIETLTYSAPAKRSQHQEEASTSAGQGKPQRASYTPVGGPTSTTATNAYGKTRGKSNAQTGNVPTVQTGGSFEVAPLPAMPGTFRVGTDKNVSAIVGD